MPGSGNVLIDAIAGIGWLSRGGDRNITYVFDDSFGFHSWTSIEKTAFRSALQQWANVANLTFTEVSSTAGADLQERWVSNAYMQSTHGDFGGFHQYPRTTPPALGEYNYDGRSYFGAGALSVVGYGFQVFMHEIGHGLGLAHTHDTDMGTLVLPGVTSSSDLGTLSYNQNLYSIMSYNNGPSMSSGSNNYGHAGSPMAFDIAAIQFLYGANTSYHTGNDTYVLPGVNATGTYWQSIWDAGGADAIRYDGALDATLDLRAATLVNGDPNAGGFVSQVAGIFGGFTIAHGVVIENASGGFGNDHLFGNDGDNSLGGGDGNDTIVGNAGNDTIFGGIGNDSIGGNAGNDIIVGQDGNDTIGGDDGNDQINGGPGNDTIFGGAGDDLLGGGTGDDIIVGMDGNDTIWGEDGADHANGGAGKDILVGGAGNDELGGGADDDIIVGDDGDDTLFGEDGNDNINGGAGKDVVVGNSGNDTLGGGDGDDTVVGNDGDDVLFGEGGNDRMNGGDGADVLIGGAGNDELGGGAGNDDLNGGAGNDTLFGEAGNDTLNGSTGSDVLLGMTGNDVFAFTAGDGSDIIADFTAGADHIWFYGADLHSFADVKSHATFNAANGATTVSYAGGILTLNGVSLSQLTAGDFIFT